MSIEEGSSSTSCISIPLTSSSCEKKPCTLNISVESQIVYVQVIARSIHFVFCYFVVSFDFTNVKNMKKWISMLIVWKPLGTENPRVRICQASPTWSPELSLATTPFCPELLLTQKISMISDFRLSSQIWSDSKTQSFQSSCASFSLYGHKLETRPNKNFAISG